MPFAVVGFEARGRHGALGVVVAVDEDGDGRATALIVRGGVSEALVYHVPWPRVRTVSEETRTIVIDLDLVDFDPRLREDGTVELRLAGEPGTTAT